MNQGNGKLFVPLSGFSGREVLITGGLGFIGSNLAMRLVELGASVTIMDSLLEPYGGNFANLQPIRNRVLVDFSDLRTMEHVERLVREKEFIFHLAGQVSHGDSMRDPMLDLAVNTTGTLNLLEACRRLNPDARILFSSTRQVYGRVMSSPVDETHATAPVDANGISKLAAEQYLLLYHRVHGLRPTVLRLTNTFGPMQKLGDMRQGVAAYFIHRALTGQVIRLFNGGGQLRDFNYVDDVVEALLLCAMQEACAGGIFNLGGQRAWTLREFAELLREQCPCVLEDVPFPPESKAIDIGDYQGDYSLLQRATGWSPRIGLREGLARTLAYCRAQKHLASAAWKGSARSSQMARKPV